MRWFVSFFKSKDTLLNLFITRLNVEEMKQKKKKTSKRRTQHLPCHTLFTADITNVMQKQHNN